MPNRRSARFMLQVMAALVLVLMPAISAANYFEITPIVDSSLLYDDNLDFTPQEEEQISDYGYIVRPELRLSHISDVLNVSLVGVVEFLRYFEETDFDRTNQNYGGRIDYDAASRLQLFGDYEYIRDESTDSQFAATGRIVRREPVVTHRASGGFELFMTELTSIRPRLSYRNVEYDEADSVDYDSYYIETPLNFRLRNQRDLISLKPAYSRFENEAEETADSFRLTLGWLREVSERTEFDIQLGGRYTITEDEAGEEDDNWNGVASLGFKRKGEISEIELSLSNRLDVSQEGNLLNVVGFFADFDQRITERFRFEFTANVYYSTRERDVEADDQVFSFRLEPALYFLITQFTSISANYRYTYQEELDEPGSPVTQRNVAAVFLNLAFPQRWDY